VERAEGGGDSHRGKKLRWYFQNVEMRNESDHSNEFLSSKVHKVEISHQLRKKERKEREKETRILEIVLN